MTDHASDAEAHAIDRAGWPPGEWDAEPDRAEWRAHGFPCLIVRSHFGGALCGYVGVPPGHPLHGEAGIDEPPINVHGGITYAAACAGAICHVPREGEPADVWWFGFDCGHAFDYQPGLYARLAPYLDALGPDGAGRLRGELGTYRGLGYVRAEVESMAAQLSALA